LEWVPDPTVQTNFERISLAVHQPVPQARVYNDAAIAINNNSTTALTFNSERFDDGNLHSTSANTGRLTAPVAGLYAIGAHAAFAANSTGTREIHIRLDGTTSLAMGAGTASATREGRMSVSTVYRLTAGQYVEVLVYQNSGGSLNVVSTAGYSPEFWMVRLSGYSGEQFG
jgi:hypothetical protein